MRQFRNIFLALAAFLWLPASAHCWLVTVPGLQFLQCATVAADDRAGSSHCTGCCAVEKSQYRSESASLLAPTPGQIAGLPDTAPVVIAAQPDDFYPGILTAAPPEIFSCRHFLSRAALPARAPSLRS